MATINTEYNLNEMVYYLDKGVILTLPVTQIKVMMYDNHNGLSYSEDYLLNNRIWTNHINNMYKTKAEAGMALLKQNGLDISLGESL